MTGELIRRDLLLNRIDEILIGHEWKEESALLRELKLEIECGFVTMIPCERCEVYVFESNDEKKYCPHCGKYLGNIKKELDDYNSRKKHSL